MGNRELKEEFEMFIKMKKGYPNSLKDSTFEEVFNSSLESVQNQLNEGYIDIHNGGCDELEYFIVTKAIKEYAEKYRIEK